MRALGIGDLHLPDSVGKGGLAAYIDQPELMIVRAVQNVLAYGRRKGIRNVIFYGDICENPRMSYESMQAFSQVLAEKDFNFFIIPGNHDMKGRVPEAGHSLECVENYKVAQSRNVRFFFRGADTVIDGAKVRFLPFPVMKFSPTALNVCHLDVYGAVADNGRQILDDRRDKSDSVVVAGHIHTNQVVRNTYYSGTLYQTCFGEKPQKFFHVIDFNNVNDHEIQSVPVKPEYLLHIVTAMTKADLPKNLGQKDLVKLVLKDGSSITPDDYRHLNVVQTRSFQTKTQLAAALVDDVQDHGGRVLSTSKFFETWLDCQDVEDTLKASTHSIRRRILKASR